MRRVAKAVGVLLLIVVLAVATLLYVLPNTRWGRERVRTLVLGALDGVIAGRVSIGAIEGPLYTGATLRDVVITDSAGAPFLRVPLVRARWSPRDLWAKRVVLRDVLAERAEVVLDRPPGERWNWDRILFPDTTPATRGPGAQWGDHVVLRDLVLRDAHVVVRSPYDVEPWRSARARDSILAAAVAGETRTVVRRSGDGYQRITELRDVDARLPLLRIKEPGFVRQRYEIASARGTVLAFQPPPMLLRDARGVVELAGDSLWFSDVRTQLPATVATLDGRYDLATGALVLRGRADSLRTDDVRFLSPLLPTGGTGRIGTIRTRISGDTLGVVLDDLAIALDGGTARGRAGFGFVRDLLVFDSTRVRIDGLATRTMRRLLPDTTTVIPREGVLSGDVALDGPLTGVRLDASLRFADRRAGPIVLDARGTAGVDGEAVVARDLRLALAPVPVTIAGPSLATLGGRIGGTAVVNGRSDGWLASRLALTHTVDGRRSAVAGTARVALGGREPRVDVALGIDPLDLAVAGRFAPAAGLRGLARGSLSVQGPLSRLAVASRLGVDTAGAIALGGTVGVPTRGTPYADVRLTFDSLDLRRLLDTTKTNVPPTTLVGFADVDARGRDAASLTGTVEMQLRASDVDQIRIDTLALRARAGDGLLTLDTLAVWVGGTSVGAGGTFGLRRDRTGDLYVAAGIDSLARFAAYLPSDTGVVQPSQAVIDRVLARQRADSARIADSTAIPRLARGLPPVSTRIVPPPPIRRDSIDGAVRALARVRGNVDDVSVIADLTASQLAVGGNVARRIALGVDLEHWRTAATSARLVTTVNDVNAAGYQVDSARAQATYAWRDRRVESGTGRLALRARFLDSTEVGIDGALAVDDRSYAARVDSTSLRLPTSAWANTTPWRARWADGRLTIDSLVLETAGDARLALDAAIDTAGRATATLVLRNTQVRDLADLAQARTPADGRVSLDVYLDGTARDPKIQFLGAIRDIVLDGDSLPEARLRFTYAAREMQAVSELRRAGQQPTLRATATIPIDLALTGATTRLLDTPLTADIRMDSLDLAELPELSESVTDLKGVAVGRVQVRGTLPDDLRFEGQLALRDGGAFVVPVELTVEPIIADLKLRGDSIVVDSIRAKSGDGWTTIRGGISVTKATNPVFDLTLVSRNARFFDGQMGRMRGFTDLTLTGPYRDARIEGSVRIRNGFYYLPDGGKDVTVLSADDPTVFSAVDSSLAVARGLVSPPSDFVRGLKMNVSARVDRDVWVRGSALNVEVFTDGEVLASVNPATGLVTLDGTVSTERGQYQFFGKRFNVVRGSATFLPETPATNPLLQAIAEYSVRQAASQTLAIRLNIGGTLERPRLSLESDAQPPVPQSDLISYLAFGRNTGTLLSQEGAGLSGAGAQGSFVGATAALLSAQLAPVALGIALDQVEGNVSRWLGADVLNITAVEVPPELFRANLTRIATVLNDFTEVEYGRYFGTRTYIGVNARPSLLFGSTTSATRPVPGVRWEYRFTRNYRIETTFGPRFLVQPPTLQPQIVQPRGAFGLFVSREWKW